VGPTERVWLTFVVPSDCTITDPTQSWNPEREIRTWW